YAAFGSLKGLVHAVSGSLEMSALTVNYRSVCISQFNRVVVIYFTMVFTGPPRSASRALNRHRVTTLDPIGYVNLMDMLLHDMVSAKPVEIIPISHLIFHFRLVWLTGTYPDTAAVPIHLSGNNITNSSILYPFNRF